MQGGGLTPGDGWSVALLFVLVALGAAVAIVILATAAGLAVYIVRSALHQPLPSHTVDAIDDPSPDHDSTPPTLPPSSVIDPDAVRRMPGR